MFGFVRSVLKMVSLFATSANADSLSDAVLDIAYRCRDGSVK